MDPQALTTKADAPSFTVVVITPRSIGPIHVCFYSNALNQPTAPSLTLRCRSQGIFRDLISYAIRRRFLIPHSYSPRQGIRISHQGIRTFHQRGGTPNLRGPISEHILASLDPARMISRILKTSLTMLLIAACGQSVAAQCKVRLG